METGGRTSLLLTWARPGRINRLCKLQSIREQLLSRRRRRFNYVRMYPDCPLLQNRTPNNLARPISQVCFLIPAIQRQRDERVRRIRRFLNPRLSGTPTGLYDLRRTDKSGASHSQQGTGLHFLSSSHQRHTSGAPLVHHVFRHAPVIGTRESSLKYILLHSIP